MAVKYNKEEISLITDSLKATFPIATIKQFKEGSELFVILWMTNLGVAMKVIEVDFEWIEDDGKNACFSLGFSADFDMDYLSTKMHQLAEKKLAMSN